MMQKSLLYPINNIKRHRESLDGLWQFKFDPQDEGDQQGWKDGLSETIDMPVPASFNDFFTDKESRDYTGTFWYQTEFYAKEEADSDILLRFGSATHHAEVFVNGVSVGEHRGGFLPFELNVSKAVKFNAKNIVVVKMNNILSRTTLPAGVTETLVSGRRITKPFFDFFNYAGLQRSVHLVTVPKTRILDFDLTYELADNQAFIDYKITTSDNAAGQISVELYDEDDQLVTEASGSEGKLTVNDPTLWKVLDSYLYRFVIKVQDGDAIIDEYEQAIGIRSVEIQGEKILINGEETYLKGYGKHEDADIIGRGFSYPMNKRDFELMKWSGANSFRTSHYPYAEEVYQMADREGFLIIDEVAAVGFLESIVNFLAASQGTDIDFFEAHPNLDELQKNHIEDIHDLILRDKNHPSVFAWSLLNEPSTTTEAANEYFGPLFEAAHKYDPQQRPRTFALVMYSTPDACKCYHHADFLSLNRYYGWYVKGGSDFEDAERLFRDEMDAWGELDLNKPMIFTEYGTDNYIGESKLPSVMWAEQYEDEYLDMYHRVFDDYEMVQGEQIWNFADFQTVEGLMRVNGNKKGVFTRQRQPKRVAYKLKERWENIK